jgi:antitoxin ParD1/3/4
MEFVALKLASGGYNNQSEVIRAGLRLLKSSEEQSQRLHAAIDIGIADLEAGRTQPLTDDLLADIAERGRRRAASRKPTTA